METFEQSKMPQVVRFFYYFFSYGNKNTFPLVCLQSDGMDLEITRKSFFFSFKKHLLLKEVFNRLP